MPTEQVLLASLFVIALVGTPGPANMAMMATGAQYGVRSGVPFWLGTLTGFFAIYTLNVVGLLAILKTAPIVWNILRVICMGYILYLGYIIIRARPCVSSEAKPAPGFFKGAILHPLNPKAYAMQVTGISQFVSPERYWTDAVILALLFLFLGGALNFAWLSGGRVLSAVAGEPARLQTISVVLAGLMVASTAASLFMAA